jgi:hypothetical protein
MKLEPWKIIHEAISIYRHNFRHFLGLSLRANGWLLVPYLALLVTMGGLCYFLVLLPFSFFMLTTWISPEYSGYTLMAIIVAIILTIAFLFFASAQGKLAEAVIGQSAHQYLIGKPATRAELVAELSPQRWQFWWAQFRIDAWLSFIAAIMTRFDGWIFELLGIGLQCWVITTSFLSSILISEAGYQSRRALRMSNKIVMPHYFPVFGTWLLMAFLTSALYLLAWSPAIALLAINAQNLPDALLNSDLGINFARSLGLSILLVAGVNVLTMPLWQSLKAVLYSALKVQSHLIYDPRWR